MKIAILCASYLGFLVFALGLTVSLARIKAGKGPGSQVEPDEFLNRAVLAHSNATQYIPTLILLMMALQIYGAGRWSIWLSVAAVFARTLHPIGLLCYPDLRRNIFRTLGAALTYLTGIIMAIALAAQLIPAAR